MNRRDFMATVGVSSLALAAGPLAVRAAGDGGVVRTDGRVFRDGTGRELIFRGVNCGGASKMSPFLPFDPDPDFDTALNKYADAIAAYGFNVVRLLIIYEAAEPTRGQYDEEYHKKYDAMVAAFAKRGIYVVVDAHQDVFSRRFHGDGFPDWALRKHDRNNKITHSRKLWNRGYFSPSGMDAFQRLYWDVGGLQKSYVEWFGMLAERYRDQPMVIGFEPINEPMPGTFGYICYPGFHHDLYRLYERTAAAVQAADPRFLIFADICAIENTGTINPYKPRPRVNNLVLAPHYYDAGTFGLIPGGNRPMIRAGFGSHMRLARHWGVPVMVTEFGVSPVVESAVPYIEKLYRVFDEYRVSGTFWEASMGGQIWNHENTSLLEKDGTPRPRSLALDRPYPRATSGDIISFSYCPEKAEFTMNWKERGSGLTEIYIPARVFGTSPKVEMTGESVQREFPVQNQVLRIEGTGKGLRRVVVRK